MSSGAFHWHLMSFFSGNIDHKNAVLSMLLSLILLVVSSIEMANK